MPSKRQQKSAKRALRKQKLARAINLWMPEQIERRLAGLYENYADLQEDIGMVADAWQEHYGELSEDFVPPFFEETADGLKAADWMATYRDMMLEKYGDWAFVAPRATHILQVLVVQAMEQGLLPPAAPTASF